jgi:hypothetical protein
MCRNGGPWAHQSDAQPIRRAGSAVTSTRSIVETMGLEPTTPCLQSRCSSQLSYVPLPGGQRTGPAEQAAKRRARATG